VREVGGRGFVVTALKATMPVKFARQVREKEKGELKNKERKKECYGLESKKED